MEKGTYTVLNLEGGDPSFTVPSYCDLLVTRHLALGEKEKDATRELKKIVKDLSLESKVSVTKRPAPSPKVEYKPYLFKRSEYIDRFVKLVKRKKEVCRYFTGSVGDFNLFATRTKVPTLVFGPGGGNIHTNKEYAKKSDIIKTADYFAGFFREVF